MVDKNIFFFLFKQKLFGLLSHCFYRMVENVSLFCQNTIHHTMTQSNASKGPSGRFVFNCPVACNSLELLCTCLCKVELFCFHARCVNDFNFHSSVTRCAVTSRSLSVLTEVQ